MKYMGSKARHAKELLPIILAGRKPDQWYIEPFVGGFNIIDKIDGPRIANDSNYYLIELFRAIQRGWVPPTQISEQEYKAIRLNKELFPAYLVGFVGFGCSYAGKFFGGYARGNSLNGTPRNYCLESRMNLLKQAPRIKNVRIFNVSFQELKFPNNSIVYCDPPYKNTTAYGTNKFNHSVFWEWCRKKTKEGHRVFISEYHAPSDFHCVWEKQTINSLTRNTGGKTGIEKLFTYPS